jgi:CDP-diacylglycerol--serine O-phosphatidyltransferase
MKTPRTLRLRRGPRLFAVLPTVLTLGNVVCGFGALTFAAKVGIEKTGWGGDDVGCLFIAALLIFAAMLFDMLDGRAARWAKQSSQFGAELDSLCDAVSFGVAPAFMLIKFCALPYDGPSLHPRVLWGIAVLYVICAILRLARFNVETEEDDSHNFFSGLPSPAAAGAVVSFLVAYPLLASLAVAPDATADWWERTLHLLLSWAAPALRLVLPMVTLACACLMVSRIRYSHFFNRYFRGRKSYAHVLLVVLGIVVGLMVRELTLPVIFCGFAFSSPVRALFDWLRGATPATPPAAPEAEQSGTTPQLHKLPPAQ